GSDTRPCYKCKSGPRLTAEWIEYNVLVPGQEPRKIRRQLFDIVGPAFRSAPSVANPTIADRDRLERGFVLLGQTEMLMTVCNPSAEFVSDQVLRTLIANRQQVLGLLRTAGTHSVNRVFQEVAKLKTMPGRLYAVALARQAGNRYRGDTYLDRPNILSRHFYVQQTAGPA